MDQPLGTAMPQGPASAPQKPLDALHAAHGQAKAQFDKVSDASKIMDQTRQQLDKLAEMGEAVTSDDVLQAMSTLVSRGADPKTFITLMAGNPAQGAPPMPESGQALAAWVQQQDQKIKGLEAQLAPVHQAVQHQLGVSALHVLAAHHIQDRMGAAQGASPSAAPPPSPVPTGPLN